MARAKRRQPWNPMATVHDRRSTDKLKDAQLAPQEVDDPFEIGAKIIVMRQIRNDPLAALQTRGHIDQAQYDAGRKFQMDFEDASQGPRAIDPSAPYVDCSRVDRSVSPKVSDALGSLAEAFKLLGQDGSAIVISVAVHGMTIGQVAVSRGMSSKSDLNYLGRRFRECLNSLAKLYGFSRFDSEEIRKTPIKQG